MKTLITIAMLALLAGCETYWIKADKPAVEVRAVQYVEAPCGSAAAHGCWQDSTRVIQIRSTLAASEQRCALQHERMHAAGYIHKDGWKLARPDCGRADVAGLTAAR